MTEQPTRTTHEARRTAHAHRAPSRVLVIGAGVVGLSCAWSLQELGVEVTVVDRAHPGAGASWQNAGFVCSSMAAPLPEPSILRYGIRAVVTPGSPVALLRPFDPRLVRFMARMVRACTTERWRRGVEIYRALSAMVDASYEHQRAGGVDVAPVRGDVLACFRYPGERAAFLHEMEEIASDAHAGGLVLLTGDEVRAKEPHVSGQVTMGAAVRGQHYVTPSSYVVALASSVRARGGALLDCTEVASVERRGDVLVALGPSGELEADAVVVAAGAWSSGLLRGHGVRVPMYGGRGYSFTLSSPRPFAGPLYFPRERVAVAPQGDRVRLGGIMEFGSPEAPMRATRIAHMVRSLRPLLVDVDWSTIADEWMGPRPLSADGLPLVGATSTRGLYVAGGHGMWGVTFGPLTGTLLAGQIVTGRTPPELLPLDPCR